MPCSESRSASAAVPPRPGGPRGYVLLTIVILTVLILLGASVLLLVAKEASVAGIKEKKNTEAYGIALAGLQWGLGNLASQNAKEAMTDIVALRQTTGQVLNGQRIFPFNQNGRFAGVPAAPPAKGVSNDTWKAVGNGHYALLTDVDPLDPARSTVLRSIGLVTDGEVVLESSLTLNAAQGVPSGFVGCFNSNTRIDWNDNVGPYDYIANYRFDGGPGFPIAVSNDAPQINGFPKLPTTGSSVSITRPSAYPLSRLWRGTQSLRVEALAEGIPGIRVGLENQFGGNGRVSLLNDYKGPFGTTDLAGPQDGYAANAYLAIDPRIADAFGSASSVPRGLGMNSVTSLPAGVWDGSLFLNSVDTGRTDLTQKKGLPVIAYMSAPGGSPSASTLLGQAEWQGRNDNRADMGFYACRSNRTDMLSAVEECIKGNVGTSTSSGINPPNWAAPNGPVNTSGRAWNIVTDVVRQCTGSGRSVDTQNGRPWQSLDNPNGIKCSRGFEWLENVAACLIVPRSVMEAVHFNSGTSTMTGFNSAKPVPAGDPDGVRNDFDGCHPGCLLAVDTDGNQVLDEPDRPFRSSCINLDPVTSTVYGPGAIEDNLMIPSIGGERGFPTLIDPAGSPGKFAAGADRITGIPGSSPGYNGTSQSLTNLGQTKAYAPRARTIAGPSRWFIFNRQTLPVVGTTSSTAGGNKPGTFKRIHPVTRAAITPGVVGGFVREIGNPAFIARLDLSDRGPLGTCEQNCLAYGYGQDVTYGAHRTNNATDPNPVPAPAGAIATDTDRACWAKVPKQTAASATSTTYVNEVCNLDYNLDGLLDRKSYALISSYREECASPNVGVPYAPAVDISSDNDTLLGDGCLNRLPNHLSSVAPTYLTNFCDGDNDAAFNQAVTELSAAARTITQSQLLNQNGGALAVNDGWFGNAKCHVGTAYKINGLTHTHTGTAAQLPLTDLDRLEHQDFWIEDRCPDPVILRITVNGQMRASQTCGCGILIIENGGLTMARDAFFMWRGLVIWNLKDTITRSIDLTRARGTTLYIDGAMVVTGGAQLVVNINKDGETRILTTPDPSDPQTTKIMFRLNRRAIDEAFRSFQTPVRTIRRLR